MPGVISSPGAVVMPSRCLLKCLEAALHCQLQELLQGLLAEVFALLADEDRPQQQQVDLAALGMQILEPFLQAEVGDQQPEKDPLPKSTRMTSRPGPAASKQWPGRAHVSAGSQEQGASLGFSNWFF